MLRCQFTSCYGDTALIPESFRKLNPIRQQWCGSFVLAWPTTSTPFSTNGIPIFLWEAMHLSLSAHEVRNSHVNWAWPIKDGLRDGYVSKAEPIRTWPGIFAVAIVKGVLWPLGLLTAAWERSQHKGNRWVVNSTHTVTFYVSIQCNFSGVSIINLALHWLVGGEIGLNLDSNPIISISPMRTCSVSQVTSRFSCSSLKKMLSGCMADIHLYTPLWLTWLMKYWNIPGAVGKYVLPWVPWAPPMAPSLGFYPHSPWSINERVNVEQNRASPFRLVSTWACKDFKYFDHHPC